MLICSVSIRPASIQTPFLFPPLLHVCLRLGGAGYKLMLKAQVAHLEVGVCYSRVKYDFFVLKLLKVM